MVWGLRYEQHQTPHNSGFLGLGSLNPKPKPKPKPKPNPEPLAPNPKPLTPHPDANQVILPPSTADLLPDIEQLRAELTARSP